MLTRIVECQVRAGRQKELAEKVNTEVLSILQRQPGFVDLIALQDNILEDRVLYLSFWNTQQEAELYQRDHYDRITSMLKPFLDSSPKVETFRVEDSTIHRLAPSRAA